jgi:hypothetical protein
MNLTTEELAMTDHFFGLDSYRTYLPVSFDLCPAFAVQQIEDRGEEELVQQADGVMVVRAKRVADA